MDHADTIVIRKASQVGITEFAITDMMALARLGISGLYVLPTDVWKNTFVANRINRSVHGTPLYRAHTTKHKKDSDSLSLKTFFGVNWKFVGSQQRNNFYEFPAGALIIDEYDLCEHDNIIYAMDRLAAAERPRVRFFGNPTVKGFGIDAEYDDSDQKHWLIKCEHCNEHQTLDWFVNFIEEDGNTWRMRGDGAVCRKCAKPIDRLGDGEWVAKHPDRSVSGYHVSRLFGDIRSGVAHTLFDEWIKAQSNQIVLQRFYNNVLGVPYQAKGASITYDILSRAKGDYPIPKEATGTVAGMDVGGMFNLWIAKIDGGIYRTLYVGTVKDIEDVHLLTVQYGVTTGVIDAQPESRLAERFCREHPGWYRCFYSVGEEAKDLQLVDHVKRVVKTNRTAACDEFYGRLCVGRYLLPQSYTSIDGGDFVAQLMAPTRVSKISSNGKERMVWDEGSQPDHYFHAGVYCNIAGDISTAAQNMVVAL